MPSATAHLLIPRPFKSGPQILPGDEQTQTPTPSVPPAVYRPQLRDQALLAAAEAAIQCENLDLYRDLDRSSRTFSDPSLSQKLYGTGRNDCGPTLEKMEKVFGDCHDAIVALVALAEKKDWDGTFSKPFYRLLKELDLKRSDLGLEDYDPSVYDHDLIKRNSNPLRCIVEAVTSRMLDYYEPDDLKRADIYRKATVMVEHLVKLEGDDARLFTQKIGKDSSLQFQKAILESTTFLPQPHQQSLKYLLLRVCVENSGNLSIAQSLLQARSLADPVPQSCVPLEARSTDDVRVVIQLYAANSGMTAALGNLTKAFTTFLTASDGQQKETLLRKIEELEFLASISAAELPLGKRSHQHDDMLCQGLEAVFKSIGYTPTVSEKFSFGLLFPQCDVRLPAVQLIALAAKTAEQNVKHGAELASASTKSEGSLEAMLRDEKWIRATFLKDNPNLLPFDEVLRESLGIPNPLDVTSELTRTSKTLPNVTLEEVHSKHQELCQLLASWRPSDGESHTENLIKEKAKELLELLPIDANVLLGLNQADAESDAHPPKLQDVLYYLDARISQGIGLLEMETRAVSQAEPSHRAKVEPVPMHDLLARWEAQSRPFLDKYPDFEASDKVIKESLGIPDSLSELSQFTPVEHSTLPKEVLYKLGMALERLRALKGDGDLTTISQGATFAIKVGIGGILQLCLRTDNLDCEKKFGLVDLDAVPADAYNYLVCRLEQMAFLYLAKNLNDFAPKSDAPQAPSKRGGNAIKVFDNLAAEFVTRTNRNDFSEFDKRTRERLGIPQPVDVTSSFVEGDGGISPDEMDTIVWELRALQLEALDPGSYFHSDAVSKARLVAVLNSLVGDDWHSIETVFFPGDGTKVSMEAVDYLCRLVELRAVFRGEPSCNFWESITSMSKTQETPSVRREVSQMPEKKQIRRTEEEKARIVALSDFARSFIVGNDIYDLPDGDNQPQYKKFDDAIRSCLGLPDQVTGETVIASIPEIMDITKEQAIFEALNKLKKEIAENAGEAVRAPASTIERQKKLLYSALKLIVGETLNEAPDAYGLQDGLPLNAEVVEYLCTRVNLMYRLAGYAELQFD